MNEPKGSRLIVNLGAAQTRKRLKGFGHGVRKIQTAGKGKAVIIHTAKGRNLDALKNQFADVGYWCRSDDEDEPWEFVAGENAAPRFIVGDNVIDVDREEWGTGIVIEDRTAPRRPTAGQLLTIEFENRGKVLVFTSQRVLTKVGG
jgi:hypothetical protein